MSKKNLLLAELLSLPLAAAGLAFGQRLASTDQPQTAAGYVCPATGELLPCPACCPLEGK